MRKFYTIILLAFIGLSFKANAQIVNIPDTNFYNALLANGVHDSAGYITVDTAKAFKGNLNVSGSNILDLTGIEAFTAITFLDCSYNYFTSLNVSSNTVLTYLGCSGNNLTSLDVSYNTALTYFYCYQNNLTSLNLSSNTALTLLWGQYNSLTSLDLSSNAALAYLNCYSNNLTSLDVSYNTALTKLVCSNNNLISLNVKNGNNHNMDSIGFYATNNPSLSCIQVDDTVYSKANWTNIDSIAHFSADCHYVGINELKSLTNITIYPNPFTSAFEIETTGVKAASINIYDVLGQLIYSRNLTENRMAIDMNTVPAGIYLIQITDADKNIINKRIIKQ